MLMTMMMTMMTNSSSGEVAWAVAVSRIPTATPDDYYLNIQMITLINTMMIYMTMIKIIFLMIMLIEIQ